MKACIIFDLDGVLVDNVEYERAITEGIIREICRGRGVAFETASELWQATLEANRANPRWHDYGLHCSSLGISDVWRPLHEGLQSLIQPMPGAIEALQVARGGSSCWLASDATLWVIELKLRAIEYDISLFDEVFSLDRCHADKGSTEYWNVVRRCVAHRQAKLIYVDNRLDRLASASKVLPDCALIQVVAEDHPSILGFHTQTGLRDGATVRQTASLDLPCVLRETLA